MRRTGDKEAPKGAGGSGRDSRLFARGPAHRLVALRRLTGAAMLCGIALSPGLWFPARRSFPRAPLVIALPQSLVAATEYVLAGLLVTALACLALAGRARRCLIAVIVLLAALVMLDQTRLQPWVYL